MRFLHRPKSTTLHPPCCVPQGTATLPSVQWRSSDKPDQASGGVSRFRFSRFSGARARGWQRHGQRPSECFSTLRRHLPGQERAEVCRALAAMVGTGLQKHPQPMMGIEPPKHDRLQHTKHHRGEMRAPHAARAIIVLAPDRPQASSPRAGTR